MILAINLSPYAKVHFFFSFQFKLYQTYNNQDIIKYRMTKKILIILFALILLAGAQKYKKITHTTDPDARCLDGSPPALYVHQGTQKDKFIIFLEGGGFCQGQSQAQTLQSCYQRSKTILGSSNLWPLQADGEGYLSTNPSQSKFAEWTKIILIYCDGSLHQGHRPEPIKYKNSSLYFRGSKIIKAQLTYIQQNYQISKATKVIWTGGSAGAVGAYLWSGFLRQFVQKEHQLYIIVDSGIFLDSPGHGTTNHHFSTELKNLYKLSNLEESTPLQSCNAFNAGNEWKCFLLQYNYKYLEGNFLYINSQYDSWAIPNILKIKCLQNASSGSGATLTKCTKAQMTAIEQYRKKYQFLMFDILNLSNKNSLWSIGCANHVYACLRKTYQSNEHRVPEMTGSTVRDIVENYVLKEQERSVSMDLMAWPSNHPCAI